MPVSLPQNDRRAHTLCLALSHKLHTTQNPHPTSKLQLLRSKCGMHTDNAKQDISLQLQASKLVAAAQLYQNLCRFHLATSGQTHRTSNPPMAHSAKGSNLLCRADSQTVLTRLSCL